MSNSVKEDRMVQQLYYMAEVDKVDRKSKGNNRHISIAVLVDGSWPWHEKEFEQSKSNM